jgi:carboxymethylenebutenolidase
MCFAFDAHPPELPADLALPRLAGGAPPELLQLTSADGARFSAAFAESPDPRGTAVAIIPDVRGLYPFYIELAERFAHAGHHAIVIDPYGRTADQWPRDADFDFWPHVHQADDAQVRADVGAALAEVRARTGAGPAVVLGFCFGGAQAFLAARDAGLEVDAVVGFYGALEGSRLTMPSPKDHARDAIRPVLALFGGADEKIPAEHREEFATGLRESGVEHEIVVYDGAPHSFFDRSYEEHAEACDDAWRRVLGFLDAVGARARA